MENEKKTRADQHDHNNKLPKDVLNLEQDPDAFRDPLQQQLEKSNKHQNTSSGTTSDQKQDRNIEDT